MASISELHIEALAKLKEVTALLFVNTWNNQFAQLDGKENASYSFPLPCGFIELKAPQDWQQLGGGYQQADVDIIIHIGQDYYDNQAGNMEQNLSIYALRDLVVKKFSLWKPTSGSHCFKVTDEQSYDHSNVYHYILSFRTGFIEDVGSEDVNAGFVEKDPPTDLEVNVTVVDEITE